MLIHEVPGLVQLFGPQSHPRPLLGVPAFPTAYPPQGPLRPPPAHRVTQSFSCTLTLCFFKNRLRYQPGQLRDLDTSWGLRNVSKLPRSFISVQIFWVIDCMRVCECLYLCMCVRRQIAFLLAKEKIFCPDERVDWVGDELLGRRVSLCRGWLLLHRAAAPVLWWVRWVPRGLCFLLLTLIFQLVLLFLLLKTELNVNLDHVLLTFGEQISRQTEFIQTCWGFWIDLHDAT